MATYTPNLGLLKPDKTDYVSVVEAINNNMDIIDSVLVNTGSTTAVSIVDNTMSVTISGLHIYRTGNFVMLFFNINDTVESGSSSISAYLGVTFNDSAYEPITSGKGWGLASAQYELGRAFTNDYVPFHPEITTAIAFTATGLSEGAYTIPVVVMYICKGDDNE